MKIFHKSIPNYPVGAPEFTPGFKWGTCYSIFSFMCMFCRSLFILLSFSFGHCVVCPSSIYGFWLPFGIFKLFFIQRFAKQTDYNRINLDLSIPCVTHILNGKLEQKREDVEDYSLWCFWSNWTLLIKICVQYFQRIRIWYPFCSSYRISLK